MKNKLIKATNAMLCALFVLMSVCAMNVEASTETIMENAEPKLIVEKYELASGEITKGEKFTLKITVKNTNIYADAYNVLVTYTSETDNVRLIDNKSNQYFTEYLGAGETFTYDLELEVLEYFEMDTMVLDFIITYIGEDATGYTNTTLLTPQISKNCAMEVNSINMSKSSVVGAKSLVNVRYSNTGVLPIEKVYMIINGDISQNGKTIELEGVLEGEQKNFDYYVNFLSEGNQSVDISFVYEDKDGNQYKIDSKKYEISVTPYQSTVNVVKQDKSGLVFDNHTKVWIGVICGAALVLLALISIVMVVSKKGGDKNGLK